MKQKMISIILIGMIVLIPWGTALANDVVVYYDVNEWGPTTRSLFCQGYNIQMEGEAHTRARAWSLWDDQMKIYFFDFHITEKGIAFSGQDQWEYKYITNYTDHLYLSNLDADIYTDVHRVMLKGLNGSPDLTLVSRTHYLSIEDPEQYKVHTIYTCE